MKKLSGFYSVIKNSTNPKSIKEIIWVVLGQGINVILSLIIVKFISQIGPSDYGIYALILTISALLGLVFGSFQQGFIRYYYDYKNEGNEKTFIDLFYKFLSISVIILLLFVFLFSFFGKYILSNYSFLFLFTAGLMVITTKVSELFNSWFNILRQRRINAFLISGEKGLIILFFLLLLYEKSLSLENVIIFIFISTLLFIIIKISTFKIFIPKEKNINEPKIHSLQKNMRNRVWIYAAPFLIWAGAGWLQLSGEKWIINGLLTVKDVGIYAIMMSIVNALVVIPSNIINEFATPIIFQNYSDLKNLENVNKGHQYIKIIMLLVFVITIISTVITYYFGTGLILIISSKEFVNYWYLLPLLTFGTGLFYTGQTQTVLGMALDRPRKYLPPKLLIGFLAVIFNLIFIKTFGLNGVAYTILLVGFIYIIHITVVNRNIEDSFNKQVN